MGNRGSKRVEKSQSRSAAPQQSKNVQIPSPKGSETDSVKEINVQKKKSKRSKMDFTGLKTAFSRSRPKSRSKKKDRKEKASSRRKLASDIQKSNLSNENLKTAKTQTIKTVPDTVDQDKNTQQQTKRPINSKDKMYSSGSTTTNMPDDLPEHPNPRPKLFKKESQREVGESKFENKDTPLQKPERKLKKVAVITPMERTDFVKVNKTNPAVTGLKNNPNKRRSRSKKKAVDDDPDAFLKTVLDGSEYSFDKTQPSTKDE